MKALGKLCGTSFTLPTVRQVRGKKQKASAFLRGLERVNRAKHPSDSRETLTQ